MASGDGHAEVEGGGLIHAEPRGAWPARDRSSWFLEDVKRQVLGLGRMSRVPSAWMMRQLTYRDRECRFPACGRRRYIEAHHIVWGTGAEGPILKTWS